MKVHHATAKKAKAHGITLTVEDGEIVASKGGARLAAGLAGNVVLQTAIDKLDHSEQRAVGVVGKPMKAAKPAKQPKAPKPKKPAKSSGPHEDAARAEGWTPVKGGGYKQAGVDGEDGGTSEAASWRDLCDEQDIEVESEGRSIIKSKYRQIYRPHHNTNGDDLAQQLREYLVTEDQDGEERIDVELLVRFAKANDCWVESYSSLPNTGMMRLNIGNRLRAKVRKDPEYAIKWPK